MNSVNRQLIPNFLIIGAMKSGTTSLRYTLSCHPEVFMVYPEEPRFFYHDENYRKGLAWYGSFFEKAKGKKAIGEGSGFYAWKARNPETIKRIANTIPDVKIIYMVRHPIERIASHWAWEIASGKPLGSIKNAVQEHRYFIEMSMYWEQISAYRQYFPDHQIKVLFLEDLKSTPYQFYQTCFEFLGVDADFDVSPYLNPQNQTEGQLSDRDLLIKLRRIVKLQKIKQIVPQNVINWLRLRLKTQEKAKPTWSNTVKRELENIIYDDSMQFLKYCNKPQHFWKFENQLKIS